MTKQQALQYCLFYKGEAICPKSYDSQGSEQLWTAEKYICDSLSTSIDVKDPRHYMEDMVSQLMRECDPVGSSYYMKLYSQQAAAMRS